MTTLVVAPLMVLLVLELLLRLCGYGYSTRFLVRIPGQEAFTTNPKFGWRFMSPESATQPFPVIVPAPKAAGTKRVFVLGESAAQGTPIPAFGFSRILQVMLEQAYPGNRVELFNVAMRGINSHAIVSIARECVRHEPDLFIIYMGNNETVGLHAPKPGLLKWVPPLWMLQLGQAVKDTKVGQLLAQTVRMVAKSKRPKEQNMDLFRSYRLNADDPQRQGVYNYFRANLAQILQLTHASGAEVILCTVAGNVVDFPPLGSVHRPRMASTELANWEAAYQKGITAESAGRVPEAMTNYLQAARLDDHYAEMHYRLGRCHWAAGEMQAARKEFELARDWDALQFRTDGRLNGIIRELADLPRWKSHNGASLRFLDVDEVFTTRRFELGSPEPPLFHEHVHLTFEGDYLLAQTLLSNVTSALRLNRPVSLPTRDECAAALGFSPWHEINVATLTAKLTSLPPFLDQLEHAARQAQLEAKLQGRTKMFYEQGGISRSIDFNQAALARRPSDWQMHMNFGMLLSNARDQQGAVREYAEAVRLMPVYASLRTLYGQALWQAGKRDEAVAQLKEALKVDPDCAAAKEGLKAL